MRSETQQRAQRKEESNSLESISKSFNQSVEDCKEITLKNSSCIDRLLPKDERGSHPRQTEPEVLLGAEDRPAHATDGRGGKPQEQQRPDKVGTEPHSSKMLFWVLTIGTNLVRMDREKGAEFEFEFVGVSCLATFSTGKKKWERHF